MKAEQTFTIKETAVQTGISEDTIRYYEKIALLPRADRKDNGHRVYSTGRHRYNPAAILPQENRHALAGNATIFGGLR